MDQLEHLTRADKAAAVYKALTERRWEFWEPDFHSDLDPLPSIRYEWTDSEILERFWPHWLAECRKRGIPEEQLTHEDCIGDFVVTNWAVQVR